MTFELTLLKLRRVHRTEGRQSGPRCCKPPTTCNIEVLASHFVGLGRHRKRARDARCHSQCHGHIAYCKELCYSILDAPLLLDLDPDPRLPSTLNLPKS